jgi:hypothetical protein
MVKHLPSKDKALPVPPKQKTKQQKRAFTVIFNNKKTASWHSITEILLVP